jgi:hypothetical protein
MIQHEEIQAFRKAYTATTELVEIPLFTESFNPLTE